MKKKIPFKGRIRIYLQWPLYLSVLVIAFAACMYMKDTKTGLIATAFALAYTVIAVLIYLSSRNKIVMEIVSFATQYGQVQKQLLRDLELPYALLDDTGKIIWTNEAFERIMHLKKGYRKSITSLISELNVDSLPRVENETERLITFEEHDYRISMKRVSVAAMFEETGDIDKFDSDTYLVAFFMFDETKMNRLNQEIDDRDLAAGLIYIDNYDEALESVEEVRRSLLVALIDRKINKYFATMDAIVKKLEKDKFLVVMQKKYLKQLTANRFDILEEVKTVNIGNELAVTLSIGFGVDTGSFMKDYEYARTAIDLALGRGGDQAIVKKPEEISYYGGKSQKVEKNTRVKARVKAQALREIIANTDKIIVMGHRILDVDAFGAAIGVYRMAKTFGKKVQIVVDEVTTSIRPMMDAINADENYEENLFINSMIAMDSVTQGATLVVVDVDKPSFTECPELLERCTSVVVIDHHRQGVEKIENPTLPYVEPYASSASEMVAELLQYISDNVRLSPIEADCLYSGMMIDTNNFLTKTGVRTFEAAAYLRRNGADVTRVRKLFRDDYDLYKARADIVRCAEIVGDDYAIAITPDTVTQSPTIIGAQAANELLNISGIRASFVLTQYQDAIYVSARSIDEVNVQIIMEKLGGGGHMTVAGCQLKGVTIDEARQIVIDTIMQMEKEGEI